MSSYTFFKIFQYLHKIFSISNTKIAQQARVIFFEFQLIPVFLHFLYFYAKHFIFDIFEFFSESQTRLLDFRNITYSRKKGVSSPVFFLLPEKMKSARDTIFWYFFSFFSRVENIFLAHFSPNFLGNVKFSREEFQNFSRVEYYFSRAEILEIFVFSRGKFCIFFSGTCLFFSGRILQFFLGNIFFFSGSFQDFFSGSFKTSRADK